jgi:hypothetical protein
MASVFAGVIPFEVIETASGFGYYDSQGRFVSLTPPIDDSPTPTIESEKPTDSISKGDLVVVVDIGKRDGFFTSPYRSKLIGSVITVLSIESSFGSWYRGTFRCQDQTLLNGSFNFSSFRLRKVAGTLLKEKEDVCKVE